MPIEPWKWPKPPTKERVRDFFRALRRVMIIPVLVFMMGVLIVQIGAFMKKKTGCADARSVTVSCTVYCGDRGVAAWSAEKNEISCECGGELPKGDK